jgi:hypothetical protein
MKKLAAMTALAVILSGPALANKSYNKTSQSSPAPTEYIAPGSDYTLKETRLPNGDVIETRTSYTTIKPRILPNGEPDFTGKYALEDGRSLDIRGTTVYVVNAHGSKYYAPTGSYVTKRGETFYTEDGQFLRMENPPQIVSVDTGNMTE